MEGSITPFIDKINAVCGAIAALLTYFLGEHWILFLAFLMLNVVDYVTGSMKAHINHISNSKKGFEGALKKLGYWIMVVMAFGASAILMEIGETIGIDLHITSLIGWFVLSTLIINEARSILENLLECGFNVPKILTKGLEVVDKMLEDRIPDTMLGDEKESKSDES